MDECCKWNPPHLAAWLSVPRLLGTLMLAFLEMSMSQGQGFPNAHVQQED